MFRLQLSWCAILMILAIAGYGTPIPITYGSEQSAVGQVERSAEDEKQTDEDLGFSAVSASSDEPGGDKDLNLSTVNDESADKSEQVVGALGQPKNADAENPVDSSGGTEASARGDNSKLATSAEIVQESGNAIDNGENVDAEATNAEAGQGASSETETARDGGTLASDDASDVPTVQMTWLNFRTYMLLGVVLVSLAIASLVGRYMRAQNAEAINAALVRRFRHRLRAWWLMAAILVFGFILGSVGTVVLFGLVSFWALREFITMAPTRRGDHRALFWALIVFTPLQYVLIGLDGASWTGQIDFYGLYTIMIPVYATLFVPSRIAISGDHKRFLERSAQITAGLLICVYALSHAPALINLELTDSSGTPWTGSSAGLLFFFVLMAQLSDILQWTWSQIVGKSRIAEDVSTSRTWEGFIGGTLSTGVIGSALYWVTPFTLWQAACMSMVVSLMGMLGGLTMSAIKRDRGVTDYGSLVLGHAGVLDRIDTVCFAAPVFYHLTRLFFT